MSGERRGLFLVLEGIEGSGKSTQARMLAEWLASRGVPHLLTREPGGTAVGEDVRRIVLQGGELPGRAELLLMLAARAVFVEQVVKPALAAGCVVVSDRYALSSFAYQGYGRGLPIEEVRALNAFATGGLEPDLTLVLEVPRAVGDSRRRHAGRPDDRIEGAGVDFHDEVSRAYALLARSEPAVEPVDGSRPPEQVHEAVIARLAALFPETFASRQG